jgi:hypothetical protein
MNTFNGNKENIFFPSWKKSSYHISKKSYLIILSQVLERKNYHTVQYSITLQKYNN